MGARLDGAEPARAVPDRACPRGRRARARRPRAPLARARSGRRTSRSRSSPASSSSAAGCRSRSVGDLRAARPRLDARHVRRPGARPGVERIVVCTPPRAPGSSPRRPSCSGSTRSGRSAARRRSAGSPTSRRVDKIVGPGNRYVNEAKLLVSRDVAIDLPAGPSEVVVLADAAPTSRVAELELAAQAEHGPDAVCRVVAVDGDLEAALAEVERLAPEHLVLLGEDAEALAPRVRNAGAVFVGASSPVAAGDYATGGNHVLPTGGWARSVGGLGLETFLKPVTVQRLTPDGLARLRPVGRGARRGRGHARARGGGAAMRAAPARASPPTRWAPSTDELARLAGPRPVADRPLRRQRAARSRRPRRGRARSPARSRDVNVYAHGGYPRARARDRRLRRRRAREHRPRRRRGRPDPPLRARVRRPRRHGRDRAASRRTRSSASPRGLAGADGRRRRAGAHVRLPPEQPDRRARRAARRAAARRRRGVLRVRGRDRGRPLLDDGVDRAAHVLEGVRARGRARRLRARRRATPRAELEPPPGAAARLDALGRARARRARRAARRRARRSRSASGSRRRCARSGSSRCRRTRTSSSSRSTSRRRSATALLRSGRRRARATPTGSGSRSATARTTTCCSRRSRARSTGPRRSPPAAGRRVRHLRATAETRIARPARARRREPRPRRHRRRPLRPPARAARLPRRPRPRARGRRRPRDRRRTTRPRTPRSRSARRSTARSATGAGSRATATRSCRWTTRSRARPSTSAAGRGPSSRSSATRAWPAHVLSSLAQAGRLAIHVEASGRDDAPRRRGGVQGGRPRAARRACAPRAPGSRRRRACCEGRRLRLRRRERPLGRGRARAARRRRGGDLDPDAVAGADLAVLPGVGSARERDGRAPRDAGSTRRCAQRVADGRPDARHLPRPPARARGARRRTAASTGLGLLPGRAVRLARGPRVPRIGWAEVEPARRRVLLRALVRRRDAARDRVVGGRRRRGARGQLRRRPVPPGEERRRRARADARRRCLSRA